jgi:hypothetical protein
MMVPHEISILMSSDPSAGAINRSSDGSQFEIQLEDALRIPNEAINVSIDVEEATVWWVIPNIITDQNDRLYITAPNAADVLTAYVVVIPQGLYDLAGLNQAIQRELQNQGAKIDPSPAINLSPDDATQRVELTLNYVGSQVDFTPLDTFREILGFNSQVIGPTVIAPFTTIADGTAAFNQVNYFLIHSDLTNKGIRFNNQYNQTISQVLIDVPPGSQIVSRPFNPARINAHELAGTNRTSVRLWLTDDKNRPVNTNNEYFTARIAIKYLLPHVISPTGQIA